MDSKAVIKEGSIWRVGGGSKALIKEGSIWHVGDRATVRVWQAPRIADDAGRFITSTPRGSIEKVNDLIAEQTCDWNVNLIEELFNECDAKCNLAIPLCASQPPDEQTWALPKDGIYSVKTAYMLSLGCSLDNFHQN